MPFLETVPFRLFWVALPLVTAAALPTTLSAQEHSAASMPPVVATNVGVLLQHIEAAHSEDVERDSAGNVVSVTLRTGWANDRNLILISTLDSVRRLVLMTSRRGEPTQYGLDSLRKMTNLVSLYLDCGGPLPEGVFRATCNLKHLRCLGLYAAYPPVSEYDRITNLQELVELHITYCTNFGDAQLTPITKLPNLRNLELKADALSSQATNLLSSMRSLTNVVIRLRAH